MEPNTLERCVAFRREIHQYPEIGFEEFQTRERIKKILAQFGVSPEQMHQSEPTALYVDIKGKAEPSGKPKCIGFRADMDALSMVETNDHLEYKSKNHGKAHMCGHDGHMACLVAFVPLFLSKLNEVPSDKTVRLLFQPSEQGPESGAKRMIKNGVIDDVDEVYGFHQWPVAPLGQLWCKEGPVMSECTLLQITIIGTSGHGSQPEKLKECTRAGVKFYQRALDYLDALKEEKKGKYVCTLPVFQAGERFNVISESCFISGTIRSFVEGLNLEIIAKLTQFLEDLVKEGFKYKFYHKYDPLTANTKEEAEHVLRIGKKVFGEGNSHEGELPLRASEDFGQFTQKKPGAFFFLSTAEGENPPMVHNSNFNFNDKLIPKAAEFWLELAMDRLK